ncbi:MAG: diguanylate cyclase [Candidatus Aminicenantes bacterium]|nr:diguanylate cyclase [Candidatus Aminicenantes bacterium]
MDKSKKQISSFLNSYRYQRTSFPNNILILNKSGDQALLLDELCADSGRVLYAPNLEKAASLAKTISFNVLIADNSLAGYTLLQEIFNKNTSLIITGYSQNEIISTARGWPQNRFVATYLFSQSENNKKLFKRTLETASNHSHLHHEIQTLRKASERKEIDYKKAFREIKQIKKFIRSSIVKEMEKRVAYQAKYDHYKKERLKIEILLKKLYMANDVTSLIDTIYEIKELINASGTTIYILEENHSSGKYLKPLVWDDSILSHVDFTKHIVHLNDDDFAAKSARLTKIFRKTEINTDDSIVSRYREQLNSPLFSIMCIPIIYKNQLIGILEVYNKQKEKKHHHFDPQGFDQIDQDILVHISEHIAIAITKLNLIQYDPLTGLLRPDPFFEKIIQKIKQENKRHREAGTYALVMGDVDWFKNYNDKLGHESGNRLLRKLGSILKASTREEDFLCRYGGEEFLFFLSGLENEDEALIFTDRIRKNVEEAYFENQEIQPRDNLTMSFGITNFFKDKFTSPKSINRENLKNLVNEADQALAEAKGKRTPVSENKDQTTWDKNRISIYHHRISKQNQNSSPQQPDSKQIPEEKRKHTRYYSSVPLIYKNKKGHEATKTINISQGGVKVASNFLIKPHKDLDLILVLGNKAFECKGQVIYSHKGNGHLSHYYAGIEFTKMSLENKKMLKKYVSSLS